MRPGIRANKAEQLEAWSKGYYIAHVAELMWQAQKTGEQVVRFTISQGGDLQADIGGLRLELPEASPGIMAGELTLPEVMRKTRAKK